MSGICGNGSEGAESIVVSGGYEDDEDYGDEIIYTGAGGNDPNSKRQIADQTVDQPGNAGLVTSQTNGIPVRVVRGSGGDPVHSPAVGLRYDGLYRVSDHWSEDGKRGFRVWRYRLQRLDSDEETPYLPPENLPPGRQAPGQSRGVTTRILRLTEVSRAVKAIHKSTCQVCGLRLGVPGGSVIEGGHIRALGSPHKGPDTPDNVLCLCPNHHALFDQGGITLSDDLRIRDFEGKDLGALRTSPKHVISIDHVRYHRGLWLN
jgi:putative restriction endonuclease